MTVDDFRQEVPYPDLEEVQCACGEKFTMRWNGGELDSHICKCGRRYAGEHRVTVMVINVPRNAKTVDDR